MVSSKLQWVTSIVNEKQYVNKKMAERGKERSVTEGKLMNVVIESLAYAYARTSQGFCVFCCHKCHTFWITPCYCVGYLCFIMFFDAFAENVGLFC